ncbi:MAG: DUF401 family protein [Desulfobacterales bacterium]|nr:DUF401 family protein [Desulfobacterales bacterium]
MAFLDYTPAVVRVLIVFAIILLAIRKKLSLGAAFLLGAAILGLIFRMGPLAILETAFFSLIDPKTLSLSVVVALILVLSNSMEHAGQMDRLLSRFQGLVRHPGVNLTVFPALIGLLPMPGGAVFSAPMVKTLGDRRGLTGAQLSYVNYWFRHIWEYWWPLYPGVLLTTALANLDLLTFVLCLAPITVVAVAAGFWPVRAAIKRAHRPETPPAPRPSALPFIKELAPILIVIVLGLGAGVFLSGALESAAVTIGKELGLIGALLISIWWVWRANGIPAGERWKILVRKQMLSMIFMVAAILIFKGVLEDSRAVASISQEFLRWRIPLLPISIILPMLVGAVAGITIAFVGSTFPILISLIHSFGEAHLMLPYLMLAMVSGFVGVLFSPLHLCLLLSNEYFNTNLESVYRCLLPPCGAILIAGCVYFWALSGMINY